MLYARQAFIIVGVFDPWPLIYKALFGALVAKTRQ
jgi:hypothetical protein